MDMSQDQTTEPVAAKTDLLKVEDPRVMREANRVYITGLEKINFGAESRYQNSAITCYTLIARTLGGDIQYDYLMGLSAAAFKLQFGWGTPDPHANVGFNNTRMAGEARGIRCNRKRNQER